MDQPFRKRIILSEGVNQILGGEDCFLYRPGFQLIVARTGAEVLAEAARAHTDAVLLEEALSGARVEEICRNLRTVEAPPPVLVVGSGGAGAAALREWCDEFIPAPASANTILSRLAAFLGLQFRLYTRLPAVISISFGRIISEFLGYSKDISEGGILVETVVKTERGRRLHLRLFLEGEDRPLIARATVLRVEPSADEDQYLIGMQFNVLEADSAERLRRFIRVRAGTA